MNSQTFQDYTKKSKVFKYFKGLTVEQIVDEVIKSDTALKRLQCMITTKWFEMYEPDDYKKTVFAAAEIVRKNKLYDPVVRKELKK